MNETIHPEKYVTVTRLREVVRAEGLLIRAEMQALEHRLGEKIEKASKEQTRSMFTTVLVGIAAMGAILALLKYFS